MPRNTSGVNRITPFLFQVPPRPLGASQMVCTDFPARSTFFNFPWVKKAIHFASGDQNGCIAPSVPCTTVALASPKRYVQSTYLFPCSQYATIAATLPSADSVKSLAPKLKGHTYQTLLTRS